MPNLQPGDRVTHTPTHGGPGLGTGTILATYTEPSNQRPVAIVHFDDTTRALREYTDSLTLHTPAPTARYTVEYHTRTGHPLTTDQLHDILTRAPVRSIDDQWTVQQTYP